LLCSVSNTTATFAHERPYCHSTYLYACSSQISGALASILRFSRLVMLLFVLFINFILSIGNWTSGCKFGGALEGSASGINRDEVTITSWLKVVKRVKVLILASAWEVGKKSMYTCVLASSSPVYSKTNNNPPRWVLILLSQPGWW